MHQRVLVLGGRKPLLAKTRAMGAEAWHVQRPAEYSADTSAEADVTLLADYTDLDTFLPLAAGLHQGRPFDAVVAIAENALLPAAELTARLGLRGPSVDAVRVLVDKWAMRGRLAERGVCPVASALGATPEDIRRFGRRYGYPLITKPVAGTGSYGVTLVTGPDRADAAATGFAETGASVFLMEEYLDGPEISVESFSFNGTHVVYALTDKLVGDGFIEIGHSVPGRHSDETYQTVSALISEFLDAVELHDGPSHVEVKLTARGPRVIEGHSRRGGDRINDLVNLVYGIDFEELMLSWALGRIDAPVERPPAKGGAAIRFLSAPQGRVTAIDGPADVRAQPEVAELHVNYALGDHIGPVRWSLDRPGFVITTGDTTEEADRNAEVNAARIVFTTDSDVSRTAPEPDRHLGREVDLSHHLGYHTRN
jgi:biotin carboxylase